MDCPPVLFIIFNRPDRTSRVFERIREARPAQLFVAADGPRTDRPDEGIVCARTRKVVEDVDWPCEVHRLFREENLGCTAAVGSAITWFFEQVEMGIVLEDDCLPDLTFFPFCNELLAKYRDDERVMMIGGTNLFGESKSDAQSYYFSLWGGTWGWASWKRAWSHFDGAIRRWPEVLASGVMESIFAQPSLRKHWEGVFQQVYDGSLTGAWDYEWLLACWLQNGYRIVPETNLISNIGFSSDGTHCFNEASPLANIPTQALTFPLRHPSFMRPDAELEDAFVEGFYSAPAVAKLYPPPTILHRARAKMSRLMQRLLPSAEPRGQAAGS